MSGGIVLPAQLGRYRLIRELGSGGMGSVYLAEDTALSRMVAVKVPQIDGPAGSDRQARFLREARLAASIDHPNVCPVHDVGEANGLPYLVMPLLDGVSLASQIDPDRPWPADQALALVRKLALACQVMHERGIIHRDLKPANVMMKPGGEPVIMDFGLAKSLVDSARPLTRLGSTMGTPAYMAPEQVQGDLKAIGPATDIYALGALLYQLLTGRCPFEGPATIVMGQVLNAAPSAPSTVRPGLGPHLDPLVLKAMAKKPEERYASMAEFAAVLEQGSADATIRQRPAATPVVAPTAAPAAEPARLITVRCPNDGTRFKIRADFTGRPLCPHCKAQGVRSVLEPDPAHNPGVSETREGSPRRRGPLVVAAGGLLLTIVAAAWMLRGPRTDPGKQGPGNETPGPGVGTRNTGEPPPPLRVGDAPPSRLENSLGMKFVLIPAGRFGMGSPPQEPKRNEDEIFHEVEITRPFYLGIHEVTQDQYQKVMGSNPSWFTPTGNNRLRILRWLEEIRQDTRNWPVEFVSWGEANEFCRKLSDRQEEQRAGRSYRLPTEAEWEYACRGGMREPRPFGLDEGRPLTAAKANHDDPQRTALMGPPCPRAVGSYPPNPWGLHDMHGNVWEWVSDWYGPYPAGDGETIRDPIGPIQGAQRVLRGGSWYSRPGSCRSAVRYNVDRDHRADDAGFRVVCIVSR